MLNSRSTRCLPVLDLAALPVYSRPIMSPEMGRCRMDDCKAVHAVCRTVLKLADQFVFPGEMEWLRELPNEQVRGVSFDAHFRLQEDVLDSQGGNSRTMIVVRFSEPGQPLQDEPWTIRIRGTWPRTDRLPDSSPWSAKAFRRRPRIRSKRKLAVPERRRGNMPVAPGDNDQNKKPAVPWGRHDNLWVTPSENDHDATIQALDMQAQIGLFLLAAELVPRHGPVRDDFAAYVRRHFRWRG